MNTDFGPLHAAELCATIDVRDARFYRDLAFRGTLGAAESYMDGRWNCDDLVTLFRILCRNADVMATLDRGAAPLYVAWEYLSHLWRRNCPVGSRKNIAAHYDLGDDFFSLFLDPTMTYSAAIFPTPNTTLEQASAEKYDRICRKLELSPSDHVLEIGTGWGGFALHAARNYGCRVTTTTISRKQFEYASKVVADASMGHRVTVLCEDYRALRGEYDKLVSIEMVEAVGHAFLDTFFAQCSQLLKRDGMMLLQAITIPDQRYDAYRRSVDFIQQHIFPGGCLPSIARLGESVRRASDLQWRHLEDFGFHYAATMNHWRRRFWASIDAIRRLGFGERFVRMWDYYLCYCEAGFLENQIGLAQIVFNKPGCRRPPLLWG